MHPVLHGERDEDNKEENEDASPVHGNLGRRGAHSGELCTDACHKNGEFQTCVEDHGVGPKLHDHVFAQTPVHSLDPRPGNLRLIDATRQLHDPSQPVVLCTREPRENVGQQTSQETHQGNDDEQTRKTCTSPLLQSPSGSHEALVPSSNHPATIELAIKQHQRCDGHQKVDEEDLVPDNCPEPLGIHRGTCRVVAPDKATRQHLSCLQPCVADVHETH
mmetsp:Transcript_56071/g.149599  ORF Transcript_56071/g.149599 Transcript_56071/m.149599 type:complete len:219 (-) Transcript_56071:189-845(-)